MVLQIAEVNVDAVDIHTKDMMSQIHELDEAIIKQSNRRYVKWVSAGSVENLAWGSDRILSSYEDSLKYKVREGLTGVSPMESRGLSVLYTTMNIMMDIDDSALRSLTEHFQVLRLTYVPGENVETIVS